MNRCCRHVMPVLLTVLVVSPADPPAFAADAFTGTGGVFYKATAGYPVSSAVYGRNDIAGVTVMFRWGDTETAPGVFDWSAIDREVAAAAGSGKKISLLPLGTPDWIIGGEYGHYWYLDENTYHPTFGQYLPGVIPWDPGYIVRYEHFLRELARKYAGDTTVCYVNTVAGPFSRDMPDSVLVDTLTGERAAFWEAFDYDADTLAGIIMRMTDLYMELFPRTPLWFSVDYVIFEPAASGRLRNYLAGLCVDYGLAYYPERFGLFREDLQPCWPVIGAIPEGNHWYLMQEHPCRTGAQMLWSVQDGPERMNKCGLQPNTKEAVFDSAINHGLALGMRYVEVYGMDVVDPDLAVSISRADSLLRVRGEACVDSGAAAMREPPVLPVGNGDAVLYDVYGRRTCSGRGMKTGIYIRVYTGTGAAGVYLYLGE